MMERIGKSLILLVVFSLSVSYCSAMSKPAQNIDSTQTIWLDQLDINKCVSDTKPAQKNQSMAGIKLRIAGNKFDRGICVSAPSVFRINLNGNATRFTAMVGMDDEVVGKRASYTGIRFQIAGDKGQTLWESDTIKPNDPPVEVDVDLTGVKTLELWVDSSYLHMPYGDWANAKIEYKGKKPQAINVIKQEPYILTPEQNDKPQINGPEIFGARPNNPILYKIPVTGKKPVNYSVENLPTGLALDSKTGIMTGTIQQPGEYKMTFTAENSRGKTNRDFTLVIGDTICLTPPMGWNSWNCWAHSVDDQKIRDAAKAMIESGLADRGWSYINIDDCWHGERDPNTGEIQPNEKFPDMKALADYVHSLGLKIGLYTDCGPKTCAGFAGSEGHEEQDIMTYAEWGFDYVKIDWCYCEDKKQSETYPIFGDAIKKAKRDIVFSICEWGGGKPWLWGEKAGGNCWRTTGDIVDTWESIFKIGFSQGPLQQYAGPGHWNDPDMMVIGKVGWGPSLKASKLTPDEQYTHVSLWCLLASPLLIGCDMNDMDEFTLNLLTNDEVLTINQDKLGSQGKQLTDGDTQIWVKDLADGSKAIGMFNLSRGEQTVSFTAEQIQMPAKSIIRDLWRQKNIGKLKNTFSRKVPAHGVVLVRVLPKTN